MNTVNEVNNQIINQAKELNMNNTLNIQPQSEETTMNVVNIINNQQPKENVMANVMGRVSPSITLKEQNRKDVIRFLGDAIKLAATLKAVVTWDATRGRLVELSGETSAEESKVIFNAIHKWWNFESTKKAFELAQTHTRLVEQGRIALEGVDAKINELYNVFLSTGVWEKVAQRPQKMQVNMNAGIYAVVSSGDVILTYTNTGDNRWTVLSKLVGVKAPARLKFSSETFSKESVGRMNRFLFQFKKDGPVFQFKNWVAYESVAMPHTSPMSLLDALLLAQLSGMKASTMDATPSLHFGAKVQWRKKDDNWVAKIVSETPFTLLPVAEWGITQGANVLKGYAAELKEVAGWLERTENGYRSVEKPSKAVARINKLVKGKNELNTIVLKNIFILNTIEDGVGKELLERALGTGVIYVPRTTLVQYGQCRVVSEAKDLGLKGTFSPVAFLSQDLERRGITLLSFGSAKGGAFGVRETGAVPYTLQTELQELDENGCLVKHAVTMEGYFLETLEVVATNQYLIQSYMPSSLEKVLEDWEEATGVAADKVLTDLDIYDDNPAFVAKVRERTGSSVVEALNALVKEGEIKEKSKITTLTPTEFDVMATFLPKVQVKALVQDLVNNGLNKDKKAEYKIIKDFLDGADVSSESLVWRVEDVYQLAFYCMSKNNLGINVFKTKTPSRKFLVDFIDGLYGVAGEDPSAKYINIVSPDGNSVAIPTGKFLEGSTFKSSPYLDYVVASGFISHMLAYLELGVSIMLGNPGKPLDNTVLNQTVQNLACLLESNLLGKDVGRLNVKGGYFVLSVNTWSKSLHTVFAPSAKKYSKAPVAMVTKHPAIFKESHCGANVVSDKEVYATLVGDTMSSTQLDELLASIGNTVFCHPYMLLGLQNDSDGDLVRLSWHGVNLPFFEGATLKGDYLLTEFHNKYKRGELDFFGKGSKEVMYNDLTKEDILEGCLADPAGKEGVSLYTAYSQRFAQLYGGVMNAEVYQKAQIFMGMWIQEFAMNCIKHKAASDETVADIFYARVPKDCDDLEAFNKELYGMAVKVFREYEEAYGIPSQSDEFLSEFFFAVREMLVTDRSVEVMAISRDRSVEEVSEESLRGKGFQPRFDASMIEYVAAKVLES